MTVYNREHQSVGELGESFLLHRLDVAEKGERAYWWMVRGKAM